MSDTDSINVTQVGVNLAAGATTASAALPVNSAGQKPNFIRVQATGFAHVRIGGAGVTAVVADMLVTPNEAVILNVKGPAFTNFATIQDTTACVVNVVPLEWG